MQSEKSIPKRCQFQDCKHKLTLASFACRCQGYYCPHHRAAETHACNFNYRKEAKEQLLKTMSTAVVAEKLALI